ncbi:hypothetical protein V5O48_003622 [Marasmius crinis-equi]|uniref:Chromo domain-containing protein n=1 Tax=Marasmius crinis-equi TaxID=585013 RepID=A0ABR3FTC8_9AGAR
MSSRRKTKKNKPCTDSTDSEERKLTPKAPKAFFNEDGDEQWRVEFVFAARIAKNERWVSFRNPRLSATGLLLIGFVLLNGFQEYLTKWLNFAAVENSWEPEESFEDPNDSNDPVEDSVGTFWQRLGGDASLRDTGNYAVGKTFVLEPEALEDGDDGFKVSRATRRSEGLSQKVLRRLDPLKIKIPARKSEERDEGYETGSTSDPESDDDDANHINDSETAPPDRKGRKAKEKSKPDKDMFPESTQPHLVVPASFLKTKMRLLEEKGYNLQVPGDAEQTFKAYSANPRSREIFRVYSRPSDMNQSLQQLNETTLRSPSVEEEVLMDIEPEFVDPASSFHVDSEESSATISEQHAKEVHADTNTIPDDEVFNKFLVYPEDEMDSAKVPESNAEAGELDNLASHPFELKEDDLGEMELMYPSDGEELDGTEEPSTWDVITHKDLA